MWRSKETSCHRTIVDDGDPCIPMDVNGGKTRKGVIERGIGIIIINHSRVIGRTNSPMVDLHMTPRPTIPPSLPCIPQWITTLEEEEYRS